MTRRYLSLYFTQLKDSKTLLRGDDLIRMGFKPGPLIKKALDQLLKARLDEQVVTRQDEMEYLGEALRMES
jgi:tRNA nucleotidyltransferase (CCA-adding enzyme)